MDWSGDGLFYGDDTRWCFVRVDSLQRALKNAAVLDALMKELGVPGKPVVHRSLDASQKVTSIEEQIEHLRRTRTSIWHGVPAPEILAGSIYRSALAAPLKNEILFKVDAESALLAPVAKWIRKQSHTPFAEVPLGTCRADVLGFDEGVIVTTVIAVELKNNRKEMSRGLDQMTTYSEYANTTYLACTPAFAAGYLDAHANGRAVHRWDPSVLTNKCQKFGIGILLVEQDSVVEHLAARENDPQRSKLNEVRQAVARMAPVP